MNDTTAEHQTYLYDRAPIGDLMRHARAEGVSPSVLFEARMPSRPTLLVSTPPRSETFAQAVNRRIREHVIESGMTRDQVAQQMHMSPRRLRLLLESNGALRMRELEQFGVVIGVDWIVFCKE